VSFADQKVDMRRRDRDEGGHLQLKNDERDVLEAVTTVLSEMCAPGEWMPFGRLNMEVSLKMTPADSAELVFHIEPFFMCFRRTTCAGAFILGLEIHICCYERTAELFEMGLTDAREMKG
jgi:hypothetical protein